MEKIQVEYIPISEVIPLRAIQLMTEKEEIIFDPFIGTGTTLIASEKSDRICYGIELNNIYCSYIL